MKSSLVFNNLSCYPETGEVEFSASHALEKSAGPSHAQNHQGERPGDLFYIVYIMFGRDALGEFEHVVLLALLRLRNQAYGVTVRQEIHARTRRDVSIGAVYATLDRLEHKGYVKSRRGDPTPERGGRAKRFFSVTAKGITAVNRTQRALRNMSEGLDLIGSYS